MDQTNLGRIMVWKTRAVQSETGSGQAVEASKKIVPQSPAVVGTEERATVWPWNWLALGQTKIHTTSNYTLRACARKSSYSIGHAPDSTRNWTTSRCPFWAAVKRGVAPVSVLPWSLLAPDSTSNRTTSRCPL